MNSWLIGRTTPRWVAAFAALTVIAAACGGGDDDSDAGGGEVAQSVETADPGTSTAADDSADAGSDTGGGSEASDEPLLAPVDTTTTTAPPAEGEEAPPPTTTVPQQGGTLRVAVEAESDGLNPAANNFAVSAYITTYPVFDPLAYYDTQGGWVPVLAESFTKIGDGGSWQMKVREGVRFHDGTELDADDVVATFESQFADPVISLSLRPRFDAENPITKIDDDTVEYKLSRPSAHLPYLFAGQLGMVLPSEWLARASEDAALNQMPVGQGPFMIESRVQDEVTVLVRNPDYWAADSVGTYLDRIEIYPITDTAIAAERIVAGDLDLVVTSGTEATLTLREAADQGVVTLENPRLEESFAVMNTQVPPFDDIRVRKALTFATDRDAYVSLIRQDTVPPADTMFHPDLIWHNPDVKQQTNMPELAGAEVASYCADFPENCDNGKVNIEYSYSGPSVESTRIADLLLSSWDDFFNVTPVEVLQDELIIQVVVGNFQVVGWRQFGDISPDNDVVWMECATVGFIALNFPRYCDPERDELMFEQRRVEDLDRRVEIWHQIQEMVRDSYTYIFYHHTNWAIGARDNVHGICGQVSPDGDELFCNNQGRVRLGQAWLR